MALACPLIEYAVDQRGYSLNQSPHTCACDTDETSEKYLN
jgi:hypothetical protein